MQILSHAPEGYVCPFCRIVAGGPAVGDGTCEADVVIRTPLVTAFVASHWWPNTPGHVLIVPNQHIEHLYTVPDHLATPIHTASRSVALAMKAVYNCDGISTRQHNEPAGNQDVWHYHLHVFPRFHGDNLYGTRRRATTPAERLPYAELLRSGLRDLN